MKSLIIFSLLFATAFASPCQNEEDPVPLVVVGGGYYHAGAHHSGGVVQLEYRPGVCYFNYLRPQVALIIPTMRSVFLGAGLGVDLYTSKHVILTPSFTPGLYYKGCGRDLGYPLEFRASIELSYEWQNRARLGGQFYHISNASIARKNPGANALTLIFAFPFCLR